VTAGSFEDTGIKSRWTNGSESGLLGGFVDVLSDTRFGFYNAYKSYFGVLKADFWDCG
jgi:hypothetical protein